LVYLMRREGDAARDQEEANFENLIFSSSVATHRPGLYYDLYEQLGGSSGSSDLPSERGVQFVTPQSEDEVQDLLAAMRETGWGG
jgi:hypothetical protein